MTIGSEEDDEAIVGSTIAEICIILILLFFLAVGFLYKQQIDNEKLIVSESIFPKSLLANLNDLNCKYELSENRRNLIFSINSDTIPSITETLSTIINPKKNSDLSMFDIGSSLPTSFGEQCIDIVCTELMEIVMKNKDGFFVEIVGHTSSEWGANHVICLPDVECRKCGGDFYCNLALSTARAENVFKRCEWTATHNDQNNKNFKKRNSIFLKHFYVAGRSSAKLVYEDGQENKNKSRRIEFATRSQ